MQLVLTRPYQINSPKNRTILLRMPFGLVDLQSLPPRSWCETCGAEVYRQDRILCHHCNRRNGELRIDN